MHSSPPLVVTLTLDEAAHEYFTMLRTKHFPKHCNYLEAHLTLFHHLPSEESLVDDTLQNLLSLQPLELEVTGLKNMGNGVAFTIECVELMVLHKNLQQSLSSYLISQDRKKLWPHITVQNKVTAFKAKQTLELLLENFQPFSATGIGVDTWLYMQGPWLHQRHYEFK
jgi:2'-5' RNA ligase